MKTTEYDLIELRNLLHKKQVLNTDADVVCNALLGSDINAVDILSTIFENDLLILNK